jgi:cytochrome c oxidase subunit 3
MKFNLQQHLFHIVNPSPWPFLASIAAWVVPMGAVSYMHTWFLGGLTLTTGLILGLLIGAFWWWDIVYEATYEGKHTRVVQFGLRFGMVLFIVSEVMFFLAFFWAYFHSGLAPTVEIGSVWAPQGIITFPAGGIPLLNTLILLLSGVTITYCHHFLVLGNSYAVLEGFLVTIFLAICFTLFQVLEYVEAPFNISDGIYGSCFFMATGFHGLHVIIGTTFITVCFFRAVFSHFSRKHHVGFEAAAWYWHFVDVVWLFLFVSIYWWSSL